MARSVLVFTATLRRFSILGSLQLAELGAPLVAGAGSDPVGSGWSTVPTTRLGRVRLPHDQCVGSDPTVDRPGAEASTRGAQIRVVFSRRVQISSSTQSPEMKKPLHQ